MSAEHTDARKYFHRRHYRALNQGRPLVFIDETGFAPSTHRDYAWAPRGEKVHGLCNAHQRPRTSLIGGYLNKRLMAPMLFEGTCDTALFNLWLTNMLIVQLPPGCVIVMDNAAFHKSELTRQIIEQAGHQLLFLPPYSPDLNPIEKLWANLKKLWRSTEGSLDELILMSGY